MFTDKQQYTQSRRIPRKVVYATAADQAARLPKPFGTEMIPP